MSEENYDFSVNELLSLLKSKVEAKLKEEQNMITEQPKGFYRFT